jgi:hypothetical protein
LRARLTSQWSFQKSQKSQKSQEPGARSQDVVIADDVVLKKWAATANWLAKMVELSVARSGSREGLLK